LLYATPDEPNSCAFTALEDWIVVMKKHMGNSVLPDSYLFPKIVGNKIYPSVQWNQVKSQQ
jgi:hypothetical protein